MQNNSKYYIDGVREDLARLCQIGYKSEIAVEILKVAELRTLANCVQTNSYNGLDEIRISGWVETEER
jgi:hypothetical protein